MPQTERDLLLADINRLRLVMASPASYRIRTGTPVDRDGLLVLAETVEQGWLTAREPAEFRAVRFEMYASIRRLGFELPEPSLAAQASDEMTRTGLRPRDTLGIFSPERVLAGLRRAKAALLAARDAWQAAEASPVESSDPTHDTLRRATPERDGPLDAEQLKRLAEITAPKQARDLLIADSALRTRLPTRDTKLAQFYSDLIELNRIAGRDAPAGGALSEWLKEAAYALGPLPERLEVDQMLVLVEQHAAGDAD